MSLLDRQVLRVCLDNEVYAKISNLVKKDFFPRDLSTVVDTIHFCQDKYKTKLSVEDLLIAHREKFPALPESTRLKIEKEIQSLQKLDINPDIVEDIVHSFWKRTKAKFIGEEALEIYLGKKSDIGTLFRNITELKENEKNFSDTYSIVEAGVDELIERATAPAEFKFPGRVLEHIPGINRGNFGIIFARPEVGKTTFSCWLTSEYVKEGHSIAYWANEEPAHRVKLRILQSYFNMNLLEMRENIDTIRPVFEKEIKPFLTVIESVGTSIREIDDYVSRNSIDIAFMDQLDKVRIEGEFTRGDERLKELYCRTREIAKHNDIATWAISQASFEAEGRHEINYSMLDNSRTGKAGEADIILGIGLAEEEDFRTVKFSKNKINGWHGSLVMMLDGERGVYI